MIKVLGKKRVMTILVLVVINAVMGAASYSYIIPENVKIDRELKSTKTKITAKNTETERLRTEFSEIQEQKQGFEHLKDAGFLSTQDRLEAKRRIEAMQAYSRVLSARYSIQAAQQEDWVPELGEAGHVVIRSPVSVEIDAMDDVDFYTFMHLVEHAFDGHTSITGVQLERIMDVNEVTLRQIGSGVPVALMKGKVDFAWRTAVPKEQAASIGSSAAKR